MKQQFNTVIICLFIAMVMFSCKKEGSVGPQGPQGPAGNPGEMTGGGEEGKVKAYIFNKPLAWKYFTSGGSCWLVDNSYTGEPQNYKFSLVGNQVEEEDVVLTYLELTGGNTFWAQLPYTSQMGSPVPTETYRAVEVRGSPGGNSFKIRADIVNTKTPWYQVKSLRVIVIPPANVEEIGGRYGVTAPQMTLDEAMEKFHLKESDFKIIQ